jgi:exodeoxyribonuclease V
MPIRDIEENWSPQQQEALSAVSDWFRRKHWHNEQIFRLFGYAGTGKTTLARYLAEDIGEAVSFAAFTGKAALVMRSKGCTGAKTIHSLIYQPDSMPEALKSVEAIKRRLAEGGEITNYEMRRLLAAVAHLPNRPDRVLMLASLLDVDPERIRKRIRELPSATDLSFRLNDNEESEIARTKLIIVDECSMVDEDLGRDLLSFGKPVLVLGDPAQLPPVRGGGFFTNHHPDVMLTEVHRQALDSPIIQLSMRVREGLSLPIGIYGESRVVHRRALIDSLSSTLIRFSSGLIAPGILTTPVFAN